MKNNHIHYTTIQELIDQLEDLKRHHGPDAAVCVDGKSPVFAIDGHWYYDGGFDAKVVEKEKWVTSKDYSKSASCQKSDGFPEAYVNIVPYELQDVCPKCGSYKLNLTEESLKSSKFELQCANCNEIFGIQ